MVRPVRVFLHTEMVTECDECGRQFELVRGGACARCRKALCFTHLHGSWVRRLLVDFGVAPICVNCRRAA